MYFDLHNHSLYSLDAHDSLEDLVKNAISCGLDCIGITDHNYYLTGKFDEHLKRITELKQKYADKIRVFAGMEYSFLIPDGMKPEELCGYDYCLFENFIPAGLTFEKVCEFASCLPCQSGLAHIDIFEYKQIYNPDVLQLMAEYGIFWELNVTFDRVHGWHEHEYCKRFLVDKEQQNEILSNVVALSVGYDTHILEDYDAERIKKMCDFVYDKKFKIPTFMTMR